MVPGGVTEVIWHFAGYLRIFTDISREHIELDGSPIRSTDDDASPKKLLGDRPDELDPMNDGRRVLMPDSVPYDDFQFQKFHALKADALQQAAAHLDLSPPHAMLPLFRMPALGSSSGGGDLTITVTYQPGGEQTLAQSHQINALLDNDSLLPADATTEISQSIAQLNTHVGDVLMDMAENANDHTPQQWLMPQDDAGAVAFITSHDQDLVARDGTPGMHSVEPGYYLNGVLQDSPPPPPDQITVPDFPLPPTDYGDALGQWAIAGNNTSVNAALIVDLTESARTMIVMGDYFKTDAIFQTNSTMDRDHISAMGGNELPFVTGGNQATNIADFAQLPGIYAELSATFAGPQWHVDVVNGDYYDVHTLTQTNYLFDNDVLVQNSSDTHFEAMSGGNELANVAQIFDGTIQYDLIIIAGAYHGMNVIFQNNVLLNNDEIKLLAQGVDPTQSVISGDNTLANTATIESYGGDNFKPMTDDVNSVVTAVADGKTTLDPSYGDIIDGSGGTFNVLYVTGNYYDVNAIWQTNVTSDVNVVMQLLGQPAAGLDAIRPTGDETQSVITGQDSLTNQAIIVDVAPTNTYVNGQTYGDTILVQANLLPTDKDHVISNDVHSLVPELVAFLNDSQDSTPEVQPLPAPAPHEDPMASIMH
jgi:hypothetical protein